MNTAERTEILARYAGHRRRFEEAAQRRSGSGGAEIIPLPSARIREPSQDDLTKRELEVLRLVSDGLADREIGHGLVLSVHTVNSHLCNILEKLGALSRAHAVAIGFRRGLIA